MGNGALPNGPSYAPILDATIAELPVRRMIGIHETTGNFHIYCYDQISIL
jgi:hypothetical protein